eukprot:gene13263-4096_t
MHNGKNSIGQSDYIKHLTGTVIRPENCDSLVVPLVNPQILGELPRRLKVTDVKFQTCQNLMVKAIAEAREELLKPQSDSDLMADVNAKLGSLMALLGTSVLKISNYRRELIKPALADRYQALCSSTVPITKYLFGDKISDSIHEINETQRLSKTFSQNFYRGGAGRGRPQFKPQFGQQQVKFQQPPLNYRSPFNQRGGEM